jgi:archaellum component FlaC
MGDNFSKTQLHLQNKVNLLEERIKNIQTELNSIKQEL